MAEHRPFPPSPRRLALAHRAGLAPASPIVVGALAAVAMLVALVALGGAVAARLGGWIAAACTGADGLVSPATLPPGESFAASVTLALPGLAAAALAAAFAQVAQTRTLWFPRRRVPDAPRPAPARTRRATFELASAVTVGAVAFGWLWSSAPRLAALAALESRTLLPAVAALIANLAVALAIAWIALGVLDAMLRRLDHTRALAMTHSEKREDDRRGSADPRWRARRASVRAQPGSARGRSTRDAVAAAAVVILGEDPEGPLAIAIAWDPVRQPVPTRTAAGRAAHATHLLGLARRHHIAVHRDDALARALAIATGPIPESLWPRLAEIVAALGPSPRAHSA